MIVILIWIVLLIQELFLTNIQISELYFVNYGLIILGSLGQIGAYFIVIIVIAELTRRVFKLFETSKGVNEDQEDMKTLNISIFYSILILSITIFQLF